MFEDVDLTTIGSSGGLGNKSSGLIKETSRMTKNFSRRILPMLEAGRLLYSSDHPSHHV